MLFELTNSFVLLWFHIKSVNSATNFVVDHDIESHLLSITAEIDSRL